MPKVLGFSFFLFAVVLALSPQSTYSQEKLTLTGHTDAALASQFSGRLPISPKVTKGKLKNGLTYLIKQNSTPENRAEIRLVVKAGSVLEDDKQQGFAHFVEHMAFNGTKDFAKHEIIDYVESIGMKFGAHLNAYTSFDETVYKLQLPTNEPQALEKGIHILENWAHKISFSSLEVDKERGVVIEEMRGRQGAGWRVFEKQLPILYKDSQYALRLPIGKKEVLENGKYADLVRFYKQWYRPELMAVIAVGDFEPAMMQRLIETYFNRIETAKVKKKVLPSFKIPDNPSPLVSIETDPELTRTSVEIQTKQPVFEPKTYDQYRQKLVSQLYIDMLNARLRESTLAPEAPVIAAGTRFSYFRGDKSAYSLTATSKTQRSKETIAFLLKEQNRLLKHGFTQTELDRHKQSLQSKIENTAKEMENTLSSRFANEYVQHFLRGTSIAGRDHFWDVAQYFLPQIKLDEVNALANRWFTQENQIVKVSAPETDKTSLPDQASLFSIMQESMQAEVPAYQDSQVITQLMSALPKAGSVTDKTYDAATASHTWRLSNGAKVILKQTDYKEDEIQFSARANGGYSLLEPDKLFKTMMAANIVEMSGVANFDLTDLSKFSKGKQFWLRTKINDVNASISGASVKKDLTHFMQMLHLKFTAPRKDRTAFTSYISRVESSIAERFNSPQGVFAEQIRLKQYSQNPRSIRLDAPLVASQDFDQSYAFYQQRFANAANFSFVFVGNIHLPEIEKLLSTYVASLPAKGSKDSVIIHDKRRSRGQIKVQVEKGLVQKATVKLNFYGDAPWSHQQQLKLDALNHVLNSILREQIREEKSGVYGVTVESAFSRRYNQHSTHIAFTCDPNRVDELLAEVHRVINMFKSEKVDSKYVDNYIVQKLKTRETNLLQNTFWRNYLQLKAEQDYQPLSLNAYTQLIESTHTDGIKQAANQYLNIKDSLTALLLPESKNLPQASAE